MILDLIHVTLKINGNLLWMRMNIECVNAIKDMQCEKSDVTM